ncbi:MAG TPA: hypothetical protein VK615_16325 [Candidatus Binatia bacterium]|nr:hypothetical protein [Candidatus Binatia bacterium]
MKEIQMQWLESAPWQSVLSLNEALCKARQTEQKTNPQSCASVEQMWQAGISKQMTLPEALELCKKCHDQSPFVFNNGNTFAAIARTLIEDWLEMLPPLEAQIVRTTVAHYVAGMVGKRELLKILDHFEPMLKAGVPAKRSTPPVVAAQPTKTASPTGAPPIQSAQPSH